MAAPRLACRLAHVLARLARAASRRELLLLLLVLIALGAATPCSLLLTLPMVLVAFRRVARWDGLALGALLLLAGGAFGLLASNDLRASLTALAGTVGAVAIAALLIGWWASPRRLAAGLAAFVAIACGVVLVATIQVDLQYAKLNALSQAAYAWFARWPHIADVAFSQNATAALIVAACPFALALAWGARRPLLRAGAALAALWLLFALMLTLSRGAYIGLALGLGAMLFLAGGRARLLAPLPPLLTVALLLRGVTGYEFSLSATPTGWSSVDRLYIWHAALRMLADFPLTGPGPGTFSVRVAAYTWPMEARDIPHAHNFLLQTYLDGGLLGLVGALVLLLGFCWGLHRLLAAPLGPGLRAALLGAAGAAVSTLAHGSVDAYFWGDPRTFYVVALPPAVLLGVARLAGVDVAFPAAPALGRALRRLAAVPRAGRRSWAALPAGLLALGLLAAAGRPLASLALTNGGNLLRQHGEALPSGAALQGWFYTLAGNQLQAAGLLDGRNGAAWQDLAEVYLDEGDASKASLYLEVASAEGQRDALLARDDRRLSDLALAQANPSQRLLH